MIHHAHDESTKLCWYLLTTRSGPTLIGRRVPETRCRRLRRLSLRRSDKALLLFSRESCGSLRALLVVGLSHPREVNKADDHGCVFRSSLLRWLSARLGLADERWNIDCMSITLLDKAYPFIVDCGGHTAQVSPGGDEATCP